MLVAGCPLVNAYLTSPVEHKHKTKQAEINKAVCGRGEARTCQDVPTLPVAAAEWSERLGNLENMDEF